MAYQKMFYFSNEDNAFIVVVPSLPGCMADGKTKEEALKNADVAITEWIDFAKELNRAIPKEDFDKIETTGANSIDVASYILQKTGSVSTFVLQKLVYYCQAWCLGIYKKRLINDTFKDYVHGPVNKLLFDTHKKLAVANPKNYALKHKFSESEKKHIDNVIEVYGSESGDWLSELTHSEAPWLITRGNLSPKENDSKDIDDKLMMEFYSVA